MTISSREIVIIVTEIIIGAILGYLTQRAGIDIFKLKDSITIIIMIIISAAVVIWIVYKKINEVDKELKNLETEQKRLNEKLKIYEQLINMKAEIKELQNKWFKYGNKK